RLGDVGDEDLDGDLIQDGGYADIGLVRYTESAASGASINVVFGGITGTTTLAVGSAPASQAVRIRQLAVAAIGTSTLDSEIHLSAGDLDGDGQGDLIVGVTHSTRTTGATATTVNAGRVFFFSDIAHGVTDLVLGDPDVGLA